MPIPDDEPREDEPPESDPMNCRRTAEQLAAFLYRDSEWEASTGFVEHAQSCRTCAETLRLLREEPRGNHELTARLLRTFQKWHDEPPV